MNCPYVDNCRREYPYLYPDLQVCGTCGQPIPNDISPERALDLGCQAVTVKDLCFKEVYAEGLTVGQALSRAIKEAGRRLSIHPVEPEVDKC